MIINIPGNQVNIQTFSFSSIAPHFLLSLSSIGDMRPAESVTRRIFVYGFVFVSRLC